MNYITTAAMVALGAVLMGWLPLSPVMGDADTQDLKRHSRMEKAAIELCGPNAAFTQIDDTVIQCLTHTGKKAQRMAIK